jgi:hypothetical protein
MYIFIFLLYNILYKKIIEFLFIINTYNVPF